MGTIVRMPLININDESAVLVRWLVADGVRVKKDEPICVVETSKSAVDVCAEVDGILRTVGTAGEAYGIGHSIGFLAVTIEEALPEPELPAGSVANAGGPSSQARTTKKAQILAKRLGVDLEALVATHPGVLIGEELVQAAALAAGERVAALDPRLADATSPRRSWGNQERVLILGGGGGAALVLDILANALTQQAVGILDNDPALEGKMLMGVPILGGFDLAVRMWQERKFDVLISTVVRDIADRAQVFERFTELGIPFTNVIAPSAAVRAGVKLGSGNLIVHGCYLATGVSLGDNNFLAAGTYIEHHSAIGSHCTFGPRTSLSGRVKVADRVKFGTHVAVEPFVEIGSGSVIASGVVLTSHLPEHSLVKNPASPIVRSTK